MNAMELDRRLASAIETRTPYEAIESMCSLAPTDRLVWWGCLCSWLTWRPAPPPSEDESLSIAAQWVFTGDDRLRHVASQRADSPDVGVCKWLLKAIGCSGGKVSVSGTSVEVISPNVAGPFVLGFMHQLLARHTTVNRTAIAETFIQLARQSIAQPLPRVNSSVGSKDNHG